YAYDTAAEGVSRHEIGFQTAPEVGRLDAAPYVALPTFLQGWTFRPQAGFRETFYTQRLEPGTGLVIGTAISNPINRNAFSASMEVRPPTLSRIFNRKIFGNVVKHTIEPRVIYRYQSGIENFSQIIRFDQRDILADTSEIEYGVINRLYAKKTKSTGECYLHPKYPLLGEESEKLFTNPLSAVTKDTAKDESCD